MIPRLLYVDDEPDVCKAFAYALGLDCEVRAATSGPEALAILREHPIDAVITDQRMPGMTGVQLLAHARAEHPTVRRYICTAYADLKAAVDAINLSGAHGWISKPFDVAEVLRLVRPESSKRAHVLLVEDDEAVRRVVQQLLAMRFDVMAVGTVSAARDALEEGCFDAVVSDYRLPDGTGADVCASAALHSPTCARLVVTGEHPDGDAVIDAINRAAVHRWMLKPVTGLVAEVTAAIGDMRALIDPCLREREAVAALHRSVARLRAVSTTWHPETRP